MVSVPHDLGPHVNLFKTLPWNHCIHQCTHEHHTLQFTLRDNVKHSMNPLHSNHHSINHVPKIHLNSMSHINYNIYLLCIMIGKTSFTFWVLLLSFCVVFLWPLWGVNIYSYTNPITSNFKGNIIIYNFYVYL